MRLLAKVSIQQAVIEQRIAEANNTHTSKVDLSKLKPLVDQVDLYRVPEKKDESGWRGPCELLDTSSKDNTAIVKHQSVPYIVPLRHIRPHAAKALFTYMKSPSVFYQMHIYEHSKWAETVPYDLYQNLHELLDHVDGLPTASLQYMGTLIDLSLIHI